MTSCVCPRSRAEADSKLEVSPETLRQFAMAKDPQGGGPKLRRPLTAHCRGSKPRWHKLAPKRLNQRLRDRARNIARTPERHAIYASMYVHIGHMV